VLTWSAEKVAEILEMPLSRLGEATTKNAMDLFHPEIKK
jgi:Tat protein secretion system quality control protein TatD with DNase activity